MYKCLLWELNHAKQLFDQMPTDRSAARKIVTIPLDTPMRSMKQRRTYGSTRGICVDLPLPVSPTTMVVACRSTR